MPDLIRERLSIPSTPYRHSALESVLSGIYTPQGAYTLPCLTRDAIWYGIVVCPLDFTQFWYKLDECPQEGLKGVALFRTVAGNEFVCKVWFLDGRVVLTGAYEMLRTLGLLEGDSMELKWNEGGDAVSVKRW